MEQRNYTFPILIEKEPEDPGYFAHSPILPGCFTDGLTVEETRTNMREALRLHVEMLLEHGDPVPEPGDSELVLVEDIVVAIPA